jgi:energy-coupling factor transport system permease protein
MKITRIHPGIFIVYFMILIVFAFLFNNPYYILTFGVMILALITLQGSVSEIKSTAKVFLPLVLFITILNMFFSHVGNTHIYIYGTYYVTLEAIIYGIIMAITFFLVTLTFLAYNTYVSYQDMLYVFSKKYPNISMIIIMSLRFVPLIQKRSKELHELSKLKNNNEKISYREKLSQLIHNLGLVVSWSLEEAMQTASSMKARGYNITKRTSYLEYKFNKIDVVLAIVILTTVIVSLIGLYNGIGSILIYPEFKFSFSQYPFNIYYLAYVVLLLPFIIIEIWERILCHS